MLPTGALLLLCFYLTTENPVTSAGSTLEERLVLPLLYVLKMEAVLTLP